MKKQQSHVLRGKHGYHVGQVVFQVTLEPVALVTCSVTKVTRSSYHVMPAIGDDGRGWYTTQDEAFDAAYRDAWFLRLEEHRECRQIATLMAAILKYESDWRLEVVKARLRSFASTLPAGRTIKCEIGTTSRRVIPEKS